MRALAIVAIVGVAIAVVLWLRGRDEAATTRASAEEAPPPRAVTPAAPPARVSASPAPADESADPTPVLDSTHEAVHAIGRRCWDARTRRDTAPGAPNDTIGRMELRIVVEIASGTAHVRETEVASTRELTDELRDCISAGVTGASWPSGGADGVYTITELFRMGDYTAPLAPPSHPPSR